MDGEVNEGAVESTPEATTPEPVNEAPWTADLRGLGLDDDVLGKVDGYMREKVQPHTTQLEQQLAQARDAYPEGHRQFFEDLQENPDEALTQLFSEVYSNNPEAQQIAEVAIRYAAANPDASDQEVIQAATQEVAEGSPHEYEVELDPEDREKLDFVERLQAEQEDKQYRDSLSQLKADNPDHFPEHWGEEELVEVLSPLVTAAPEELDDDEALQYAFDRYRATYSLIHGGDPGTEAAAAEAVAGLSPDQIAAINAGAQGPPVLQGQNASVPSQKEYGSIGEAVQDFGREMAAKRQAAPPIA